MKPDLEQFLRIGAESRYAVRASGTPGGRVVVEFEDADCSTPGPATSCGASPPAEAVLRLGLRPTGGDPAPHTYSLPAVFCFLRVLVAVRWIPWSGEPLYRRQRRFAVQQLDALAADLQRAAD